MNKLKFSLFFPGSFPRLRIFKIDVSISFTDLLQESYIQQISAFHRGPRARALCDEKHLAEELNNIEDVFVANGYPRETVRRFMEQRHQQIDKKEQEEQESRGAVTIPYLKGLSERFRRTANRHSFRVAFKPGRKIKEIKRTCQEPLGERQKCVVYKIPCTCQNSVYVGETWRLFQTRKK